MPDLIVVVPTRGRPDNARRLAQAFTSTCTASTQLLLAVDGDDPTLPDYDDLPRAFPQVGLVMCGKWQPMVPKLNQVALAAAGEVPAVGFMGDDHLPTTKHWDAMLLAELDGLRTGVVYGNDLLQGERLASAWVMTADIVAALGRMVPAAVEHMYCDNAVMDLARDAGCLRYLPSVVIEHLHPMAQKAAWDPGYWRVNRPEQYARDQAAYEAWRADGLAGDVQAVRALREVAACQ